MKKHRNRPQLWMRYFPKGHEYATVCERLRIIYPDGSAEYADAHNLDWKAPCWMRNKFGVYDTGKSIEESIRLMKLYDKLCGYKTIFLSYL